MESYIINNNTIALLKKAKKTIIYDVDNSQVFNITIRRVLKDNCLINGSTLEGRKKYAQTILNKKQKLPILISEKNKIILIQINNIRNDECYFLVGNKIIDYKKENNKLIINCQNNYKFSINISKYSFEQLLLNYLKLNNKISS